MFKVSTRNPDNTLAEEKQELVVRVASKEDRRINLVYLTDIAKPLQQITYELANQTMNEALLDISKEEIDIVKNVFQRVYDNLTNKDLL